MLVKKILIFKNSHRHACGEEKKMSCLVKTTTPFISQEILLEALEKCGYNYEIKNDKIYIPSLHKYRNTYFKFVNGKYILNYDSYNTEISYFLTNKRVD